MRQPYHQVQDQDFYCSFTHLPSTPLVEELPYTLTPRSTYFPLQYPRSSVPSSSSTSSGTSSGYHSSTSSLSSSLRHTRLLAKLRKLLWSIVRKSKAKSTLKRAQSLLSMKKPSTLDFRCCGYAEEWRDEQGGYALGGDAVSERGWFGGWPPEGRASFAGSEGGLKGE